MNIYKFPILKFLNLLQQDKESDFTIGIDDYLSVFKAFHGGFGIDNIDSLQRVLKLLLVKKESQIIRFDYIFQHIVNEFNYLQSISIQETLPNKNKSTQIGSFFLRFLVYKYFIQLVYFVKQKFKKIFLKIFIPEIKPIINEKSNLTVQEEQPKKNIENQNNENKFIHDNAQQNRKYKKILLKYNFQRITEPKVKIVSDFIPANNRELLQSFRYLRGQFKIKEFSDEIDIDETIKDICLNKFLLNPVFKSKKINKTELVLLIDCSKSMIPFLFYTNSITNSTSSIPIIQKYYFDNFPNQYVYSDINRTKAIQIDTFIHSLTSNQYIILISDAGAARNTYNEYRIKRTVEILVQIYEKTNHFVWYNPVPQERWQNNSAAVFNSINIPMYSIDIWNIRKGIDRLRLKN